MSKLDLPPLPPGPREWDAWPARDMSFRDYTAVHLMAGLLAGRSAGAGDDWGLWAGRAVEAAEALTARLGK